ncbi:MAG: Chromatin structure-remodeling complex protein rsc9 [Caeruleum heppii]|nr:MAG: Chromatin structure-remodeling complex protein rsc9 [Caeruleum heppii]
MAPSSRVREPSIDRTEEYEDFRRQLSDYHAARGTTFDPEPRVGNRHVDLLRLFKAVTSRGGYDVVCVEKLAWRKLGQDFNLGTQNLAALAFSLKTVYYKQLAAYEISTIHGREPPPKEILEDISARGSGLLARTVENFQPPAPRESGGGINGEDSDGAGEDSQMTPGAQRGDSEDPGSGGRITRGLRQAPPQRVLFQPDVSSSRQSRQASGNQSSPQPGAPTPVAAYNPASNPNSMSFTIANYEPKTQMPLTLRPVITPGNNPILFKERQRTLRDARAARDRNAQNYKGMMLPGTGFSGPNIYVRTLLALRSGIPEEEEFALHHLVKISHERGDKYRFEAFPGLAEGLIEQALKISSLFYDVNWQIDFGDDARDRDISILDGMQGTPDILARIKSCRVLDTADSMETEDFTRRLTRINEACLVLRNMVMLEENAEYLAGVQPIHDFLCIALNLPPRASVVELQHYALDITEQLTRYNSLSSDDPLYLSLLSQLDSNDRGAILTSLRSISRISMNLEESNRLGSVPLSALKKIYEWTLVDDEELVHACLDFLYQFTAVVDNVEVLVEHLNLEALIDQLVRLLLYGAKMTENKKMTKPPVKEISATEMPMLPQDLLDQLLVYDEPERSAYWLRACFEEDEASDITQIALWQAYQTRFAEFQTSNRPLLPAAEFIKNVSTTFTSATAQVLQVPTPRFIIKGIRPRWRPMDPKGRVYLRCEWRVESGAMVNGDSGTEAGESDGERECGTFALKPKHLWEHILTHHLQVPRTADGTWDLTSTSHSAHPQPCRWGTCTHSFPSPSSPPPSSSSTPPSPLFLLGMHIKTHLPDTHPLKSTLHRKHNLDPLDPHVPHPAQYESQTYWNTPVDERGDAKGLPFSAVLVLRNLARNLPRGIGPGDDDEGMERGRADGLSGALEDAVHDGDGSADDAADGVDDVEANAEGAKRRRKEDSLVRKLFTPVEKRLWFVMAHNMSLAGYMADLNGIIASRG